MLVYRLETIGSLDGLVAREEALPSPRREVLVRVRATALNYRDLAILLGRSPFPVRPGVIPVSDAAGEVEMVGDGVTILKAGDRVVSSFLPTWAWWSTHTQPGDIRRRPGWLARGDKVVRAEALTRPTEFDLRRNRVAAVRRRYGLVGALRRARGDTVLTQGSGGVSLFALQLAKLLGARVIATTSSGRNGQRLTQVGADAVVDYVENPKWGDAVRALTAGRGVDRVVEVGGPGTLEQSLRAVAYGGEIALVGALAQGTAGLDFMSVFMSQATLRCISVGSRIDLEAMKRAVDANAMHPVIDSVFPLVEAKSAWAHYAGRNVFGKVVIRH